MTDRILHLKGAALPALLALGACSAPARESPAPAAAPAERPVAAVPAPPPPAAPETTDPRALIGTRWTLVEAEGRAVPTRPPVTLEFGSSGYGGHGGCNNYGARSRMEGPRIVTEEISSTLIGCHGSAAGDTEAALFRGLGGAFETRIEPDGRLAILKEERAALRFARVPPTPPLAARPEPAALVGTRWYLVEADGRRVHGVPGYGLVTLDIGDRGFSGSSGCNSYGASYSLLGRRFVPIAVTATQRGCGPPVGPLERRLFQILGAPFEVDADAEGRLVILSGGAPVLRFAGR